MSEKANSSGATGKAQQSAEKLEMQAAKVRHAAEYEPRFREVMVQPTWKKKIIKLIPWVQNLRIMRALGRYSNARGGLLAGGIAYSTIFSLAASLAIGLTILLKVIGTNPQIRHAVFSSMDSALPGVLAWNGKDGMVNPQDLVVNVSLSIPSITAVVVLIFSATRMMTALKSSIRAMFGVDQVPDNPVLDKLRDLGGFITLAVGVAGTGIISMVNTRIGGYIIQLLNIQSSVGAFLLSAGSLLIGGLVDGLVLWMLIRVVARIMVPARQLLTGLALFAVGSGVLRLLGTSAVSSANNPLLASFAALVTLLLWTNLVSRIVLICSAFMANPPRVLKVKEGDRLHADETPNYVTLSDPRTLDWPQHTISGTLDVNENQEKDNTSRGRASSLDHNCTTRPLSYPLASQWRSEMIKHSALPWKGGVSRLINRLVAHHQKQIQFLQGLKESRRTPPGLTQDQDQD